MYLGYKSLIRYTTYKYFLPFCELSFHFLDSVVCSTKLLILMKFSLSIFSFVACSFDA